jgi:catechol 2,3-dioxygenase
MPTQAFTLGHVHIKVRDLEKAREFYTGVLGLKLIEQVGTYMFFSYGAHHHDLAIHQVPLDAPSPGLKDVGLYHFAIEVPSLKELVSVYRRLKDLKTPVRSIDHGISKVLYFSDPDGNGIEVYLDTRLETGHQQWQGESNPLNLEDLGA